LLSYLAKNLKVLRVIETRVFSGKLFLKTINYLIMQAGMRVRVIKENGKRVLLKLIMANTQMPVSREEFEKRVKDGTYEVVG
jgi:hypothetical protein